MAPKSRPSSPKKSSSTTTNSKKSTTSTTPTKSKKQSLISISSTTTSNNDFNSTILNPDLPRLPSLPTLFQQTLNTNKSKSIPSSSSSKIGLNENLLQHSTSNSTLMGRNTKKSSRKFKSRSSEDPETSFDSSDSSEADENDSNVEEEEENEKENLKLIPTRKIGFGVNRKVMTSSNSSKSIIESEFEGLTTEDEGGFATAKENSNGSLVDLVDSSSTMISSTSLLNVKSSNERENEDGKKENVVVCLRVRPTRADSTSSSIYKFTPREARLTLDSKHPIFLKRGAMGKQDSNSREEYDFKFDALHLSPSPTRELYETKIRPVVRAAMSGFNGTVFAYGQTASGKTHTMIGNDEEPGIIPLAISELFEYISEQDSTRTFTLRVSFLEIYNETFQDLLVIQPRASNSKSLEVNGESGQVKGLEERPVSGPSDVLAILEEGEMRRRTSSTDWNARSSRSHCVFVVVIESVGKSDGGVARTSRLNLIDLAGSESATTSEGRNKEGAFINKSLLTLGTVIAKLTDPKGSGPQHIPYRDSKLTRLLQPALSGNSRVAIICTISPDVEQSTETLSTLKFAKRAKMVVTKAERGVLLTERMMLQVFADQVASLKAQIASKESGIEEATLVKERDSAIAKANELQSRNQKAEDELVQKEFELTRLKEQLAHTKSFILTGPVLEENARRISGSFPSMILSPSKGKRNVSEMSGLGFGTPRGNSMRIVSGANKDKESSLEFKLLEAQAKLSKLQLKDSEISTLRSELETVNESSSTTKIESNIMINKLNETIAELKSRIQDLQSQLSLATSKVDGINEATMIELKDLTSQVEVLKVESELVASKESELVKLKLELTSAKESLDTNRKELLEQTSLIGSNSKAGEAKNSELLLKLATAVEDSARKEKSLLDMEAKLRSSEKRAAKGEAKSKVVEVKDASIASLERELSFVKKELASLTVTKGFAIQSAQDLATSAGVERDIALKSAEQAKVRINQVEELSIIEAGRHEASEKMLVREHQAEVDQLKAEILRLQLEIAEWKGKTSRLQRTLDAKEELEQQQADYALNTKSGTDSLKSKLAELQLRSTTPSFNPSHSTRSSSRASNQISPKSDNMEALVELQIKNAELQSKITEMERQAFILPRSHSTTFGPDGLNRMESNSDSAKASASATASELKERERLNSIVESQNALLRESQTAAENWREKYLESQRLVNQLSNSSTSSLPLPPTSSTRSYLREMNSDASLPRLSKGSASSFSTIKNQSSRPSSYSSSPSSHSYTGFIPPPLPYSPHNQEKERKLRRETINKDLARLAESRGVEKKIEALGNSPNTSPRKGSSTLPLPGNGSPSVKDRENFLHRRPKSSTDSARLWN